MRSLVLSCVKDIEDYFAFQGLSSHNMSRNDFDLINPANPFSRPRSNRKPPSFSAPAAPSSARPMSLTLTGKPSAVTTQEESLPAPSMALTLTPKKKITSLEPPSDEEDTWDHGAPDALSTMNNSFHGALISTRAEEYSVPSSLTVIPEGRRLVIAIDYGTTFTGTWDDNFCYGCKYGF